MRRRFTRVLTRIVDPSVAEPLAVKVPQITALFWVTKITSTAMGEALGDFLDGGKGLVLPAIGTLAALAALIIALRRQMRARRYGTATYWLAVAMVATFGTMTADSLHQFLGLPYWSTTALYAAVLAAVFWRWWANEHTLSIHSIDSRRREHFYWATVMATFALGTAAGDWTAGDLHLGFFSSGLMFAGIIVVPAVAYRLGASPIATFWFAYIITRPLGASFADWFDCPARSGGLAWGTGPVWVVLAAVMAGLVTAIAVRERRASAGIDEPADVRRQLSHAGGRRRPHPHLPQPHLPHAHAPHLTRPAPEPLAEG